MPKIAAGIPCAFCDTLPYFKEADEAEKEGHIYSEAGAREFAISGVCEYCFDSTFGDDENDEEDIF